MTIKIYIPAKTSMQSGQGKSKKWLAEYVSDSEKVKDTLMGWNSSLDTKSQIRLFLILKIKQSNGLKKTIINILLKNQKVKKLNQKTMHPILI